jgi:type I restriction enzyme R subunit
MSNKEAQARIKINRRLEEAGWRFLRAYQKRAIQALQRAVKDGHDRFLFEMATGAGKTLISVAVIKLFSRTGNARRVLFLVDRLELEDQAHKAFTNNLLGSENFVSGYKTSKAASVSPWA